MTITYLECFLTLGYLSGAEHMSVVTVTKVLIRRPMPLALPRSHTGEQGYP